MRRAFIIGMAILAAAFAAPGATAGETGDDGNEVLLDLLKNRDVLTDEEYRVIQARLEARRTEIDRKLETIDRTLADYLAKSGDATSGATQYVQNQGVTFNSGDGMFTLFFGGLFQFGYSFESRSYDSDFGEFDDEDECNGGFSVNENRLRFGGIVFDNRLRFYTQFDANQGDVDLLDAYADYRVADAVGIRGGMFKVPYGRQSLTDQSDRAFGHMNGISSWFRLGEDGRDTGLMVHSNSDQMNGDPASNFAFEWAAGVWNGGGDNFDDETNLMVGARAGVYPFGFIPYVEGAMTQTEELRLGVAGSIFWDEHQDSGSGDNPTLTAYEIDFVAVWGPLFFLAEYFVLDAEDGYYFTSSDYNPCGWYAQLGFMVLPARWEVMARYGMADPDESDFDDYTEWALATAYYFYGHELKAIFEVGQVMEEGDFFDYDAWFVNLGVQLDW